MHKDGLVSVIVPVYNVEDYLQECYESIVRQSYSNLEIILVDDGSTDGSGELCDELVKDDGRAKVIHKSNGGLSDARNVGLRASHGDWISFVDSDDYVSPVFIEVLLNAALIMECQIAAIPFGKPFKDGRICKLKDSLGAVTPPRFVVQEVAQSLMLYQALDTGAQWRLYSRALLGADPFPVGLYYEDLASVYKIIHKVDGVAVVDSRELYAYRIRGNSIVRQKYTHIKAESALKISERLYGDICAWYPSLERAAASRCFSVCRMVYAQVPRGPKATVEENEDGAELWELLKRYRRVVLLDPSARKREKLASLLACMGRIPFNFFCHTMRKVGLLR